MKNIYLSISLLIPFATYSMEIPYANGLKTKDGEDVLSYQELLKKTKQQKQQLNELQANYKTLINEAYEELGSQNSNMQTLTLRLKKSDSLNNHTQYLAQKAFQENPLLFQEEPVAWNNIMQALEHDYVLSEDKEKLKQWLDMATEAQKKIKASKSQLLKSVIVKSATALVPIAVLSDTHKKLPHSKQIEQAVITASLVKWAVEQKPMTPSQYLCKLSICGGAAMWGSAFVANALAPSTYKSIAQKITNIAVRMMGPNGSMQRKITNNSIYILAIASLAKWAWDSADEAWKDWIKMKATMTYENNVVKPIQNLYDSSLDKSIKHMEEELDAVPTFLPTHKNDSSSGLSTLD